MGAEPPEMAKSTSRVGSAWRFASPGAPCYQMDTHQTQMKRQKTRFVKSPAESRLRTPTKARAHESDDTQWAFNWALDKRSQGKIKRRAHRGSLIGIHVDVRQRCRAQDVESPALPAMSTRNVPAGRWNVTCVGSIQRKTHDALPRHTANSEHTSGVYEKGDEYQWGDG